MTSQEATPMHLQSMPPMMIMTLSDHRLKCGKIPSSTWVYGQSMQAYSSTRLLQWAGVNLHNGRVAQLCLIFTDFEGIVSRIYWHQTNFRGRGCFEVDLRHRTDDAVGFTTWMTAR